MLRNFALQSRSMRHAALVGAVALAAAAALAADISPAAAFGHGGFRAHGGGFHHGFHQRFFAFGGSGYVSGYPYDDASADDGCLRRVWGPYGWRTINICY